MEKVVVIRTGIRPTSDSFEPPSTNLAKERTKVVVVKVAGQDVAGKFLGLLDAKSSSIIAPRDGTR